MCTTGRTKSQFEVEGTGTMLSIQIGNSSDYVITMPKQESDLLPQTAYTVLKEDAFLVWVRRPGLYILLKVKTLLVILNWL